MKSITVHRFYRGKAEDRYSQEIGKFAIAKQFDILTHKKKLQPLRGMSAHTSNTGIGNLGVASDSYMYGIGLDIAGGNPTLGKLFVLTGYGSGDDFAALSTNQLAGAVANYELLVDWPDCGNSGTARPIIWGADQAIKASNYSGGGGSPSNQPLTFSSLGQGKVHSKDKYLYFPYRTTTTPYIALIAPNATPFAGFNGTAFQLPAQYRAYCLAEYGNYLAIPLTSVSAASLVNSNIVGLWDRDTTNTLFSETIPWGGGVLKTFNNLNGTLIGVSEFGSSSLQAGTAQDYNAIQIKVWNGGAEPELIAEIKATALPGSTGNPSVSINQRVNFIQNNRMYFSAIVNPNDGIQPSRIGLWSVGKNELGEWTVNLERVATNGNTETSIIAAAMVGDYLETVHTAAGTLTKSTNGLPSSTTYGATSVYESLVNPEMPTEDYFKEKNLGGMAFTCEPLATGASVVMKYRVDSKGNDSDWVTVKTLTTTGAVGDESTYANGEAFVKGTFYEIRLESVGGAVITSYSYTYTPTSSSNIK